MKHRCGRTHKGLTLVELLVVIAILGMLAAVLLPAVQAVREAARRTECRNNLRQIGLAMHLHIDARRRLPAGWIGDDSGRPGWGWAAALLPFLDEKNLSDQFKLNQPADGPALEALRTTILATLLCPSDDSPLIVPVGGTSSSVNASAVTAQDATSQLYVARANFVGMFGPDVLAPPYSGKGALFRNSQLRLVQITDGLSKTMLIGERNSYLGFSTWVGVLGSQQSVSAAVVGTAQHTPNDLLGTYADFSSPHDSTTHFLTADGGVHAVADEISLRVFRALSTRAGGEIVGEENGTFSGPPGDPGNDDDDDDHDHDHDHDDDHKGPGDGPTS